tara:strand:- start:168 stop:1004 length:837 start_codon:yes stop_codon:yes gene_type:complete
MPLRSPFTSRSNAKARRTQEALDYLSNRMSQSQMPPPPPPLPTPPPPSLSPTSLSTTPPRSHSLSPMSNKEIQDLIEHADALTLEDEDLYNLADQDKLEELLDQVEDMQIESALVASVLPDAPKKINKKIIEEAREAARLAAMVENGRMTKLADDINTYDEAMIDINTLSRNCDTNVLYRIITKYNLGQKLELFALHNVGLHPSHLNKIREIAKKRLEKKTNVLRSNLRLQNILPQGGRKKTYKRKTQIRRRTRKTTKNLSIRKRKRKRKRKTIRKNR